MYRFFLIIFSLIIPWQTAYTTDYYVSSSDIAANDSNNGTSPTTPWKSISKVNSIFSSLKPGDRILFNRGDSFYGTLIVNKSGSSGLPIIVGSYGTGDNPILSGFTKVSNWTNESNGIFSAIVNCTSNPNMVTVNGTNTPLGRYPDSGYLTIDSHSGTTTITDAALSETPNWSGAEVVIRTKPWVIDRNQIISHSNNTITYKPSSSYEPSNGGSYFIQNNLSTLTLKNEWYYNKASSKFYIFLGNSNPNDFNINVSTLDEVVRIWYPCNYITIENLTIEGANLKAFNIKSASYITIRNCVIRNNGNYGIYGLSNGGTNSKSFIITDCKIEETNDVAIALEREFFEPIISNNTITNTCTLAGMGGSADGHYVGISLYKAPNSTITNNNIIRCGYIPLCVTSESTNISYNYINTYCTIKSDGGGIYTTSSGVKTITNNIVTNGYVGIYLDDQSVNSLVSNNTVFKCSYGIYIHNAHENTLEFNTSYNNGTQLLMVHDSYFPNDPIRNMKVLNNIFFSKLNSQICLNIRSIDNDLTQFGIADDNYYARPIDDDDVFSTNQPSTGTKYRTLEGWQSFSGQDLNSHKSPIAITDVNTILFEYNATKTDKTITLSKPMINVTGKKYTGSATLAPYTSIILMVDPNPAQTMTPVYQSSVIENATPSILTMTYDQTLANIIPLATAFKVIVNSSVATVTKVSISGTKVQLTLASSVVLGIKLQLNIVNLP